ncbi:MAG: hypothetical protein H6Q90_4140, partial [Deltaproteobacteria bacterium]|nr:hypothetical protein [Deltaproteobacteria bacterium]
MIQSGYTDIERRLVAWAEQRPDVRAVVFQGSRSRKSNHPSYSQPDRWSDMDAYVLVDDTRPFLESTDWLAQLGTPWFSFAGQLPENCPEVTRYCLVFPGALQVDVIVVPVSYVMAELEEPTPDCVYIVQQGVRVAVDKMGLRDKKLCQLNAAPTLPPVSRRTPTEAEFHRTVNEFWFECAGVAKKLRRGEVWRGVALINTSLAAKSLLALVEWNAVATHGPTYNVWFDGRYLEWWADPARVERLRGVFAPYDREGAWTALLAIMDVFEELSIDTAARLRFSPPAATTREVRAWVARTHQDRTEAGDGRE